MLKNIISFAALFALLVSLTFAASTAAAAETAVHSDMAPASASIAVATSAPSVSSSTAASPDVAPSASIAPSADVAPSASIAPTHTASADVAPSASIAPTPAPSADIAPTASIAPRQAIPMPPYTPPNATNISFKVVPQIANLAVGSTQQFDAQLSVNGVAMSVIANWSNFGAGSIDANGLYNATTAGMDIVKARYYYAPTNTTYTAMAGINATAPANVSFRIYPQMVNLTLGSTQQFTAQVTVNGVASNAIANWSNMGVGSIDANGLYNATSPGIAIVRATYHYAPTNASFMAMAGINVTNITAPAPATPSGSGSTGSGSNNGGSAFRTTTTLSFSCAGKPGAVTINYIVANAGTATVKIIYSSTGDVVLSRTVSGTTSFDFTPEKEGSYEVRVKLGTDQSSAYFTVRSCGQPNANTTQTVTVSLAPKTELVLSKTITYPNGFVKKFEVWRTTENGAEKYNSQITLTYTGTKTIHNATVLDSVPKSVVSSISQISFDRRTSRTTATATSLDLEWDASSIINGETVTYRYSFARALTSEMIGSFAPPKLLTGAPGEATPSGQPGDIGSLISASMAATVFGISLPLVVLAALLVLGAVYFFVAGRKKE